MLGDEGVDSAVVGLLDPLDPLALDPLDPVDPLVPEVLVSAWMAATAASYFSVSVAITASWVVTTSSAASFAVFTCDFGWANMDWFDKEEGSRTKEGRRKNKEQRL